MDFTKLPPELIADAYIKAGYQPVPLTPKTKDAYTTGWNVSDYAPVRPQPDDNVGLRLGLKGTAPNGRCLHDIDLDCPEAVIAADVLLPQTPATLGHAKKSRSHRLFSTLDPIRHKDFHWIKDDSVISGKKLLELRGLTATDKAEQTMVPPSVHPNGCPVTGWSLPAQPIECNTPDEIAAWLDGTIHLWIAVMIALDFPSKDSHSRHDARLPLAGFLHRLGFSDQIVLNIGTAIMRIIDGDERDWFTEARSTLAKLNAGDVDVTGGKKLADYLGNRNAVIQAITKRLGKGGRVTPQPVLRRLSDV